MEQKAGHDYKFAYVELFVALGFFLVYLIEELIGECFKANSEKEKTNEMAEMKRWVLKNFFVFKSFN